VLAPVMQKMSDMQEQVDKMGAHVDKMDARMRRLRLWARLVPLYLIVVVLVSYPYVAAITGMSASDMTQYISPVTGLAGAVIGYWFGQTGPGSGPGD